MHMYNYMYVQCTCIGYYLRTISIIFSNNGLILESIESMATYRSPTTCVSLCSNDFTRSSWDNRALAEGERGAPSLMRDRASARSCNRLIGGEKGRGRGRERGRGKGNEYIVCYMSDIADMYVCESFTEHIMIIVNLYCHMYVCNA